MEFSGRPCLPEGYAASRSVVRVREDGSCYTVWDFGRYQDEVLARFSRANLSVEALEELERTHGPEARCMFEFGVETADLSVEFFITPEDMRNEEVLDARGERAAPEYFFHGIASISLVYPGAFDHLVLQNGKSVTATEKEFLDLICIDEEEQSCELLDLFADALEEQIVWTAVAAALELLFNVVVQLQVEASLVVCGSGGCVSDCGGSGFSSGVSDDGVVGVEPDYFSSVFGDFDSSNQQLLEFDVAGVGVSFGDESVVVDSFSEEIFRPSGAVPGLEDDVEPGGNGDVIDGCPVCLVAGPSLMHDFDGGGECVTSAQAMARFYRRAYWGVSVSCYNDTGGSLGGEFVRRRLLFMDLQDVDVCVGSVPLFMAPCAAVTLEGREAFGLMQRSVDFGRVVLFDDGSLDLSWLRGWLAARAARFRSLLVIHLGALGDFASGAFKTSVEGAPVATPVFCVDSDGDGGSDSGVSSVGSSDTEDFSWFHQEGAESLCSVS